MLAAEIAAAAARETPEDRVFTDAPLGALLDHIVSRYHSALREDLPHLGRMADKVAEVHGARHPELHELARVYRELRNELEPHLEAEEERVFPAVRRLEGPAAEQRRRLGLPSTRSKRSTTGPASRSRASAR